MNFLTVPETCPKFIILLLLPLALALLSSCSSSVPPELAPAEDDAQFSDGVDRGYTVQSPDFVRGNEYERSHVTLPVDRGGKNPRASDTQDTFTINASVPMGVDITSAELVYESIDKFGRRYFRTDDCEVGNNVTCHYSGAPATNAALELGYKIFAPGDHELTLSISSDDQVAGSSTNVRTILFQYVASTRYLQSLLDSAEKNALVTLPSGTYMGTLHGGNRLLEVRGAEDGSTVLLSDNPDRPLLTNIGHGSIFSKLEFRSSGAPVMQRSGDNITIRDSLIAPTRGVWHDMKQLFVNNSYRLLYSRIEGWGGEEGVCHSLLYSRPQYAKSSIYIQNTIFRNNQCVNLLLENSVKRFNVAKKTYIRNTHPSLFILNNTFVNNTGRIRFSATRNSDVQIRNNLFAAHEHQITLPPARFQTGDHHFILARNLIWSSSFESLVDPLASKGLGVVVQAPDLHTDPLFVDADGGDYSLSTGSPAIDAGVSVDAYAWTYRKGGSTVVQPVPRQEPVPVDGLLDGNAIMDIGAFEYSP